jgi:hypothetical protein
MKGWKTILLAVAVSVIGSLEAFNWADVIPDNIEPFVIPVIGVLFGYLRTITNTPVGKKDIGGGGIKNPPNN